MLRPVQSALSMGPEILHLIRFRIPCVTTGYDRVSTLPRSLTFCVLPTDFMYPVRPFATVIVCGAVLVTAFVTDTLRL